MIKLTNVTKEFKLDDNLVYTALKGINLTFKEGEFTALMGPSGSGKSTLMHIIGLLEKPTKGSVTVDDKDIARLTDDEISTLRNETIGFVFQQFNLINKLTILQNVMLPTFYARHSMGYNPQDYARSILERVGLGDKLDSYPNKISGGQQQRAAIARALIMKPRLILADEPTGNLDTKTGEAIMKVLADLNEKEKITIIIVTHEHAIANKMRRTITIRDGEIV